MPPSLPRVGEQAAPTVTTPVPLALPANIPVKWVGIDKRDIPKHRVAGVWTADTDWMGTLLDNSNIRFTGAYVTGPSLPGHPESEFTGSSKAVSRGWMANIQTLADQGWGAVFFYVGYSVGGGQPKPAHLDRARGTLHGLHLRTVMDALGPNWAGATVFIDNEDSVGTTLPNDLVDYYLALFEEMSRPDPVLAAFRPALYTHGKPIRQMLAQKRDLFVWDVWLDTSTTTTPTAPFTATDDPIAIDASLRPEKAYQASPVGQPAFISWSLGRQFRYYTGDMPVAHSPIAARLPDFRPTRTWDYNVSFVRNPAFPCAEPRFDAQLRGGAPAIVADFFQARSATAPPTSTLKTQGPTSSVPLPLATGIQVEPDAPVCLFPRGAEMLAATVLVGGGIALSSLPATGTWAAANSITGAVPNLRRSRALKAISRTTDESQLFYIGSDNRLYVKRLQATPPWTDGLVVNPDLLLHPFSKLAVAGRGPDTVETFFIDDHGLLTTAFWARWFTSAWPGFGLQRLETAPSLLPGGALAAVSPRPSDLLVFGIGADMRLSFTSFVSGRGWVPIAAAGQAQEMVAAHSNLAAASVSASGVEVAAVTDFGQLVVYPFQFNGSMWVDAPRRVISDPPALAGPALPPPAGAVRQPANGFRVNPFTDLSILRLAGASACTVYCAGLRNVETKLLMCDLAGSGTWEYFV
jgi:hypothetical protein